MGQLVPENITKKIDALGRITLPKGLRNRFATNEVELFTAEIDNKQCICLAATGGIDADKAMADYFIKVLEINLAEDSYVEIKVPEGESHPASLREWIDEFVETSVWPEDRERVLNFFADGEKRCFYRRFIDGKWKYVLMEMAEEDGDIKLLLVRVVDEYVDDFRRQCM